MNMKSAYEKSLQMIKENNIKDIKEYTKLAKRESLLSYASMEYISGKEFKELSKELSKA